MKKFVKKLTAVAVCLFGAFFASAEGVEVAASLSPFALQSINYKGDGIDTITSKYGFGIRAEGRYFLTDSIYCGTDVTFEDYSLGSDYDHNYFNIKVFPKAGFKFSINEKFYGFSAASFGLVMGMYDSTVKPYFGANLELGGGYNITKKLALELSLNGNWHYQNHEKTDFTATVLGFTTFIGAKYKL